jgi:hypothetical protein
MIPWPHGSHEGTTAFFVFFVYFVAQLFQATRGLAGLDSGQGVFNGQIKKIWPQRTQRAQRAQRAQRKKSMSPFPGVSFQAIPVHFVSSP